MHHVLSICLLFLSLTGWSQTEISGRITDENGEPLPGANIYLVDSYDGASSDIDGAYTFSTTETGVQTLEIDYIGFEPIKKEINCSDAAIALDFTLKAARTNLKTVTITASSFGADDAQKAVALKPLDIVTTAGALGDINGALQTLPGTSTVGESGRLFVRGGESRETKVFIDGLWASSPYTSGPANVAVRGRFNPFLFKGTIFSTGAYSAEYGQALSGVLRLNMKEPSASDEWNFGLMSVGGDLAGTKVYGKSSLRIQAGYINLGPTVSVLPNRFQWQDPFQGGNASLAWKRKTQRGSWVVYGQGAAGKMTMTREHPDLPAGESIGIKNGNAFGTARWNGKLGEKWLGEFGFSSSVNEDQFVFNGLSLDQQSTGQHLKAKATWYGLDGVTWHYGVEAMAWQLTNTYYADADQYDESFQQLWPSVFTEAEGSWGQNFAWRLGVRGEYSTKSENYYVSPRASLAIKTGEYSQITAAAGQFVQAADETFLLQQEDLDAEAAQHLVLNYQYKHNNRFLRAEAFYKNYSQLVRQPSANAPIDLSGNGYARGFDVFFRDQKTISNGDYWISYSYLESERLYRDYPTQATPGFVARHQVSVVYKHWISKWRSLPSVALTMASPRYYTNPNHGEFQSSKLPAYRTVNISWSYLHRENVIFFASISNVPGFKNVFGYTFSQQPDQNGFYASTEVRPDTDRFAFIGCFITLSKDPTKNQLDELN